MKIVSCTDIGEGPEEERIYTAELEKSRYVDVKFISRTGLIYVMQNEDGSEVYNPENGATHPDYGFGKDEVLKMVQRSVFSNQHIGSTPYGA